MHYFVNKLTGVVASFRSETGKIPRDAAPLIQSLFKLISQSTAKKSATEPLYN